MTIQTVNQDWRRIEAGHRVVLIENGRETFGVVDAITDDASVVFVYTEFDGQRRAIDYREGIVLVPT